MAAARRDRHDIRGFDHSRIALAVLLLLVPGCGGKRAPAHRAELEQPPTTAPAAVDFVSEAHGVRLAYPPDWAPASSHDYVLMLVPARGAADAATFAAGSMSLDVPKLPLHIPGLIPLGAVVNGYVDDLKSRYGDMSVAESVAAELAGARARRVRSTWTDAGRPVTEDAVLAVHGDRVYILRLTVDSRNYGQAREAFEGVLASVTWDP